jgi:hypothetical protein
VLFVEVDSDIDAPTPINSALPKSQLYTHDVDVTSIINKLRGTLGNAPQANFRSVPGGTLGNAPQAKFFFLQLAVNLLKLKISL